MPSWGWTCLTGWKISREGGDIEGDFFLFLFFSSALHWSVFIFESVVRAKETVTR